MTAREKSLMKNGFHKDMFFNTMDGAEAYAEKLQARNRLTAIEKGTEPYPGIYVWAKFK